MNERRLTALLNRLERLRTNHHSIPISRRRAVLRLAIVELEAELEAESEGEERAAVMRLLPPRHAPALGLYPEPLRPEA